MSELFTPLLESPVVKVTAAEDQTKFFISWPAQTAAVGYYVYAGYDPKHIRSRVSGVSALPTGTVSLEFNASFSPPSQIIYFWVSWIDDNSNETFLDQIGSYHFLTAELGQFVPSPHSQETMDLYFACDEDDQRFYFEEIRRRAKAVLEDTSEEVDLFIRQWRGMPEPGTQAALGLDPNYQGMTRADSSFGTGFFPGYFPAIRLRMRFGALPNSLLDFQSPGLRPMLTNEAWTLWDPIMHENDMVVRRSTGVRYVVNSNAFSNYRGVPIVQRLTLDVITPTSPAQKVTDEEVRKRWGQVNAADFARLGFGIAPDQFGGPNYVLF
jgi:hypothetical protein